MTDYKNKIHISLGGKVMNTVEDEVVFVAALDKGTGFIRTGTSCDRKDANHYAKYYRNIGYNARILTYEELEKLEEEEKTERRMIV